MDDREDGQQAEKDEHGTGGKGAIGKDRLKSEKVGHRRVKEGVVTYKKTPTDMLMGAIQLGLEHLVGMITNKPKRDLLMVHFSETTALDFPSDGSQQTAAHHFGEFRFKAYAQIAFRHFREEFDIKADDFLVSLARDPMRELSNAGASGSVFYLSADDEFIIKTVQHKEAKFLQHLLPGYYMNLVQNKRTLLPKFFGLYCYQNNYGRNIRFVVMNNLLPSTIKYHEKYDLKGSTFKRFASEKELAKKSPTLKDLDFLHIHPEGIQLEQEKYNAVMDTMRRDTTVLESFKIMDYSLLLGIHNIDVELRSRQQATTAPVNQSGVPATPGDGRERHPSLDSTGALTPAAGMPKRQSFSIVQEYGYASVADETDGGHLPYAIPQGGILARNSKGERLVLYIGIIDILQSYRLRKKLEHSFKSVVHDGDTVSVHRPSFYADRFCTFMSRTVFRPYKPSVRRKSSMMKRQRSHSHSHPIHPRPNSVPEEEGLITRKPTSLTAGAADPNNPVSAAQIAAGADNQSPTKPENPQNLSTPTVVVAENASQSATSAKQNATGDANQPASNPEDSPAAHVTVPAEQSATSDAGQTADKAGDSPAAPVTAAAGQSALSDAGQSASSPENSPAVAVSKVAEPSEPAPVAGESSAASAAEAKQSQTIDETGAGFGSANSTASAEITVVEVSAPTDTSES